MGSTQEEVDRMIRDARQHNLDRGYIRDLPGEAPQHRVRITRAFYLGACEVTQTQYERIMGANPSSFKVSGPDAPGRGSTCFRNTSDARTGTAVHRRAAAAVAAVADFAWLAP
jgi:formylglycine-generating enzyme required for sulfatase activity